MSVPAMRAGDVVVFVQRFANSHGHRFFANVQMRQSRHQRARIEFVDLLFKQPDHHHPPVHPQMLLRGCLGSAFGPVRGDAHTRAPDILAKTSNTTAKSFSARPIPRAAVRNSLATAVVGSGTSRCLPNSSANSISFC